MRYRDAFLFDSIIVVGGLLLYLYSTSQINWMIESGQNPPYSLLQMQIWGITILAAGVILLVVFIVLGIKEWTS